jgi:PAS domain-containing protein
MNEDDMKEPEMSWTDEDRHGLEEWVPGFELHLNHVRRRLDSLPDLGRDATTDEATLRQDLEVAHEELRVAAEEVRVQHETLETLVRQERTLHWQHERLLALLPTPILTTDREGRIRTVNSAAAGLLGLSVDRLLRKPFQVFVEVADRPMLRQDLNRCSVSGGDFRRAVTLHGRSAERRVEVVVTAAEGRLADRELTWLLLPEAPHGRTAGTLDRQQVLLALTELTLIPIHASDSHEVLARVARICRDVFGPDSSVSVTVGDPSNPTMLATTTTLAQQVDGAQIDAGEGPCRAAWKEARLVWSDDLAHDDRWPALARRLADVAVHRVLAAPVQLGGQVIGALNVYEPAAETLDEVTEAAHVLGTATAAVLFELDAKAELRHTTENLRTALESRPVIDQAKGILMAKYRCSPEKAFEALRRISMTRNQKLRTVAEHIVAEVSDSG